LKADDNKRDILMEYPPCASPQTDSGDEKGSSKEYDMGKNSGSFVFIFNTYTEPDCIKIYDGKNKSGKVIFSYSGGSVNIKKVNVEFHNRIITVEILGGATGTKWDYIVNCPD